MDINELVSYLAQRNVSRIVSHIPNGIIVRTGCGRDFARTVANKLSGLTGYAIIEHSDVFELRKESK